MAIACRRLYFLCKVKAPLFALPDLGRGEHQVHVTRKKPGQTYLVKISLIKEALYNIYQKQVSRKSKTRR